MRPRASAAALPPGHLTGDEGREEEKKWGAAKLDPKAGCRQLVESGGTPAADQRQKPSLAAKISGIQFGVWESCLSHNSGPGQGGLCRLRPVSG